MHAFLGLMLGFFSILVAFPAFAQGNQPQPVYEPEPPPLGYPQPGYPPQSYPQQGYPEQSPPQSFPPPSYYQPPHPISTPAYTRGMLVMPYVGFATPVASASDKYGTGFRIGSLLGWHMNRQLSINVEFTFDGLRPKGSLSDVSDGAIDSSFSPLFHLPIGKLELVVGPKIGFYEENLSYTTNGMSYNYSSKGLMFGFNMGALVGIGSIAIGGLFSYTGRYYSSWCWPIDIANTACIYASRTFQTVSFNGVVLF